MNQVQAKIKATEIAIDLLESYNIFTIWRVYDNQDTDLIVRELQQIIIDMQSLNEVLNESETGKD